MKNQRTKVMVFVMITGLATVLFFSCSIKAPEVNITGEKTALENQVIGTYQQIEEDVWTLTSVRSTNSAKKPKMSAKKKRVLEAVQGRKFNKDDVEEFLENGLVGENNQGLLEIKENNDLVKDADLKNRVTKIVENENSYRKIIMERIILLNEQAAEAGEKNVSKIFAKINQDNAAAGAWVEDENGEWVKKGQKEE
ncbi:DUF1318 domain-containing protein [candidate division KSB1 bacterium]|nr:DUF1318 domain-containing protein [candidate division KSB1 bacterium]